MDLWGKFTGLGNTTLGSRPGLQIWCKNVKKFPVKDIDNFSEQNIVSTWIYKVWLWKVGLHMYKGVYTN